MYTWLVNLVNPLQSSNIKSNENFDENFKLNRKIKFSPIYDSGCSLGRELSDSTLISYLENQPKLAILHHKRIS